MNPEIIWKGSEDDLTAIVGEYKLRVEQVDIMRWWWCVYYEGRIVEDSWWSKHAPDKSSAQSACIEAFNQHVNGKR